MSVRRQASSVVTGRESLLNECQAKVRYEATASAAARISASVKAKSFAAASTRRVLETTTLGFSCMLSDRPFHLQCDQAVHFNRVFHGELFDQRLDKTGDHHRRGFFFA